MKLPSDATIAWRKVDEYLLRYRAEDDKSGYLALAGYGPDERDRLMNNLRAQLTIEAEFVEQTEYGTKYRIKGNLTGPNGRTLRVMTIWMKEDATEKTKFVTLVPDL
jgi:hypothetical protein